MNSDMTPYLTATPVIEADEPSVSAFAAKHAREAQDCRTRVIRLYYAVRDGIRYDPYTIDLSVEGLRAANTLKTGRGWCVTKAILLTACCRSMGIPARLGFADVRNHLSTARMRDLMKTDMFYWHGYTSIYINDAWVKATPAFNIELCQRFGIRSLEFDGENDSLYHPFDLSGNRHMEYLNYRGEFADVPVDAIRETFGREYAPVDSWQLGDFDQEVTSETSGDKKDSDQ
jgi:transglutaminase-like putative cysteine protease